MIKESLVKRFLDSGINVLGLTKQKVPSEGSWTKWQTEFRKPQDINSDALGLICGKISQNMEVIDIDLKYDISGDLYERYIELLEDNCSGLYDALMVLKTPSGGYHWVYRCEEIEGNKKLARRPATEEEKKVKRENWKVLIETRGEGGYIASFPSEGYEVLQGKFSEIPQITKEQRDIILSCARTFDEEIKEVNIPKSTFTSTGKTPWQDFDERNSCEDLLVSEGWSVVKRNSSHVYMKRAGDTKALHSGNILVDRDLFKAFSSSTCFEPEKAYTAFGVYAMLHFNGDFSEAAKRVYLDGYGDRNEKPTPLQQFKEEPKEVGDVGQYISDKVEDDKYLDDSRSGRLERGLTTGSRELDEYFLFKSGKFLVCVGHTNVGKTLTLLFLVLLAAVIHGWKIVVMATENNSGFVKKRLMELLMCKTITDMNETEYEFARKFIDEFFIILKARGGLIKDIPRLLEVLYKMCEEDPKIKLVLADPYSGFNKTQEAGENTHDHDYRIAGDILDFTERTKVNFWLNTHTNTAARRQYDDDNLLKAPRMDDAEGGGKWTNRADNVIVLHRKTNAPVPIRYITEFYHEKDRELETGGMLTEREHPVQMILGNKMTEFTINGRNPIRDALWKESDSEQNKGISKRTNWKEGLNFEEETEIPPF